MPPVVAQPLYRQIYDLMKGDIVKGTYGNGQQLPAQAQLAREYGVSLMTLRQALDALERDGLIRRAHGRGTFAMQPLPGRQRRVLIAGGDEGLRLAVRRIVEREGFSADEASDGSQTMALATQERYDRLFLDARLLAASGGEALRAIRARDPQAAIVVSASAGDLTFLMGAELWPLIIVGKPFTPAQIVAALHLGSRPGESGGDLVETFGTPQVAASLA